VQASVMEECYRRYLPDGIGARQRWHRPFEELPLLEFTAPAAAGQQEPCPGHTVSTDLAFWRFVCGVFQRCKADLGKVLELRAADRNVLDLANTSSGLRQQDVLTLADPSGRRLFSGRAAADCLGKPTSYRSPESCEDSFVTLFEPCVSVAQAEQVFDLGRGSGTSAPLYWGVDFEDSAVACPRELDKSLDAYFSAHRSRFSAASTQPVARLPGLELPHHSCRVDGVRLPLHVYVLCRLAWFHSQQAAGAQEEVPARKLARPRRLPLY
ncbi:unnamed protein product, partial [Prorocentrum cordatum]